MVAQADKTAEIVYGTIETPVGPIISAVLEGSVCWLSFAGNKPAEWELELWSKSNLGRTVRLVENGSDIKQVTEELQAYFAGDLREFTVDITFPGGTPFQRKVWHELRNIPYGEVRSYKDIAKGIGAPKAVRAVGGANNKNPISIIVPCHRVIGSNGSLVGYGGGLDKKKHLLELEGFLQ